MNIRVDGRGVSSKIADKRDRMGAETETVPGSAPTLTEDLTAPDKEVTAVGNRTLSQRQQIALDYLAISRREFDDAARNRIRYVLLARDYGLTHAAIGDTLGITESAVRGILARHGGA